MQGILYRGPSFDKAPLFPRSHYVGLMRRSGRLVASEKGVEVIFCRFPAIPWNKEVGRGVSLGGSIRTQGDKL